MCTFDIYIYIYMYRLSQEEMSLFWEVILSVILSKKVYICTCVLFRDRAI
jgi:hypothetical protein